MGKANTRSSSSTENNSPEKGFESLSEEGKAIVSLIKKHFDESLKVRDEKIEVLQQQLSTLQDKVTSLENQIDSNSAYDRRETLVLSGNIPPVNPNENCNNIVRKIIKDQTHLIINDVDISTAHRLGRKPDAGSHAPDKRSIIFKLCRRDIKRDIFQACKNYKPNFYINEHLTPTRGTIMYALRKAKQLNPEKIGVARTHEGNISVQIPADRNGGHGRRVQCNTRATLDQLLAEQLNVTSAKCGKNWP